MNENTNLVTNKDLREELIGKVEVLDKVGTLLLLDELDMATVEMVAKYYEVDVKAVEKQKERNYDEFENDGYGVFNKENVQNLLTDKMSIKTKRGGFDILNEENEVLASGSNKGIALFPKRAILRMGDVATR